MNLNPGDGVTVETAGSVTAEASGAGSTGDKSASAVIRELRERAQKAETALAEVAAKEETVRQDQLKAAGKFDEVEKELKGKLTAAEERAAALEAKAAEYEKQQTAVREANIAALPETHRGFASTLTDQQLSTYMVQHGGVRVPEIKPKIPGVTNGGKLSPDEIKANAKDKKWLAENFHRM